MKIGIICDAHMPYNRQSAQWEFCLRAVKQFQEDGIQTVITLGDITAFGEEEALDAYLAMMAVFDHYWVLGNAEIRDKKTASKLCGRTKGFLLEAGEKKILGIHTPKAVIAEEDQEKLRMLSDGDVVVMHHPPYRLFEEESVRFMDSLCTGKKLTILCAHLHRSLSGKIGQSHYYVMRAIDPDKSFGSWPAVAYFDTDSGEITEKFFPVSLAAVYSAYRMFGISCVDNHRDVAYALEHKLYGIELRCNGKGWEPDLTLLPKINAWREAGGKYLSIHMPNLYWKNGEPQGVETWHKAVAYANTVNADGMTIHPPRVKLRELDSGHDALLEQYVYAVQNVPERVNIGIENLHMSTGEEISDRGFGYIPEEVADWIDQINQKTNRKNLVGHTLDVGHARNNQALATQFPVSRWYEDMGNRTVAYHIHQVQQTEAGLKNHNAIENWFGPQISYASFFYHWENGGINRAPVFLEVKGADNFDKSIRAFQKCFEEIM